jgi:membrane protein
MRIVVHLLRETYAKWNADNGWLYAAAMAAFAALALAPLLVIVLRVAEAMGGGRAVLHGLALVIDPIVGRGGVRTLRGVAAHGSGPHAAWLTALAVAIALFSGARLFYALERALHAMWNTPMHRNATLGGAVLSFLIAGVLTVCVIAGMTVVIFGSATFAIFADDLGIHGAPASFAIHGGIVLVGAVLLAPIVAALFRWLPGAPLTWGDVWIGAVTTTVGFAVFQFVIGIYLASVNLPWTYGSAASIVVVLLWLYYSSYLFLLGAEFTHVYAREFGSLRKAST